jgi:excisionase family DNA binding protein
MSPIGVINWPNVRDVAKQLDVSPVYVNRLVHQRRLEAVRTRLGFLIDPERAAAFQAERAARQRRRSA